jgi:hypothetical protein
MSLHGLNLGAQTQPILQSAPQQHPQVRPTEAPPATQVPSNDPDIIQTLKEKIHELEQAILQARQAPAAAPAANPAPPCSDSTTVPSFNPLSGTRPSAQKVVLPGIIPGFLGDATQTSEFLLIFFILSFLSSWDIQSPSLGLLPFLLFHLPWVD